MTQLINRFVYHFVEESQKKQSLNVLYDSDINQACYEIQNSPVSITPRAINAGQKIMPYQEPQIIYIYPSKEDTLNYLEKTEQLIEALHGISNYAVFEIRGNKKQIACLFYCDNLDYAHIEAAIKAFYPKAITEKSETLEEYGSFYVYDFLPNSPFYKSLTTYRDYVVSPVNLIPQLLLNIDEDKTGVYQVLISPIDGEVHSIVKEAIDCEWKSLQGTNRETPPSLEPGTISKKIEYKSPDFKSYFAVCARIILPTNSLNKNVKAFISNYTYGSKAFSILDNQYYSQVQIMEMLNNRMPYHSGFLLNSHELTSLLHVPHQIINDKEYRDIFAVAPVGDKPIKTTEYKDIEIGTWACGNSSKKVHLPIKDGIHHVHSVGLSRSGKSVLLGHIAVEKFKRKEAVFVLDPHGDLIGNILRMIPKRLMDNVIVIDFGLKDATPQITIRENIDILNPSKASDDLSESMKDVTNSREFWGPKMSYYFSCLYFIYSVLPDLNLTHIRQLVSTSSKAKVLRTKVKSRIKHPIVKDFIEEIEHTPYESMMPVVTRLSHLLLDEKSLRLFTLDENKISISDIMENGKLCLVNLSVGIIGKQRSSILSGLIDSMINNNALARASVPYNKRKPCTVIKDEFYLGPGDLDSQLTGLAKYGLSVVFAHQYLDQVEGRTKDVMATAGTRIVFKLRREDAEIMGRDFNIEPVEFTSLRKFQAIVKIEDEVVKINTPKPKFRKKDYSEEIMRNCFLKYYLINDGDNNNNKELIEDKKELTFDTL